jgi:hypothetical protein
MLFRTWEEIEVADAAALEALKATVADKDVNPFVPGAQFDNGMFEGFYTGMVVGKIDTHIAIWNEAAARVAIVPTRGIFANPAIGSIVAIQSWGGSRLRRCVPLTTDYDWLDAFDDFIVAFQQLQQQYNWMDIATKRLTRAAFVLDGRNEVASWYHNLAYNPR